MISICQGLITPNDYFNIQKVKDLVKKFDSL